MNYQLLKRIIMEWSVDSKEYYLSYILYTEFKTPFLCKYTYMLTKKMYFKSAEDVIFREAIITQDQFLSQIIGLFKYSKYSRLHDGSYGYTLTEGWKRKVCNDSICTFLIKKSNYHKKCIDKVTKQLNIYLIPDIYNIITKYLYPILC